MNEDNDYKPCLENDLMISAQNEDALSKAVLLIESQMLSQMVMYEITQNSGFRGFTQQPGFGVKFTSIDRGTLLNTYKELEAIETISIYATWLELGHIYDTRYRWRGEYCEVIERCLNRRDTGLVALEEYLKLKVPELQKQRDDLDLVIGALGKFSKPEPQAVHSDDIPF